MKEKKTMALVIYNEIFHAKKLPIIFFFPDDFGLKRAPPFSVHFRRNVLPLSQHASRESRHERRMIRGTRYRIRGGRVFFFLPCNPWRREGVAALFLPDAD